MTSQLAALVINAHDPAALAVFYAGVLGREVAADGVTLLPDDAPASFAIRFAPSDAPKLGPNQMHFDLTSTSLDDQRATVERALALGGSHLDIGQGEVDHVVLADPEGNELDVIEPGNNFLAGTGVIGALSSDGSPEVGRFWSEALGWPLVWDQDDETAIQAPAGGTKITWGGPPYNPKLGDTYRLHLDLVPATGTTQADEVARLERLGASRVEIGQGPDATHVVLVDPDGHEFCVLAT